MNASGSAGDYNSINQYGGNSYLVFGKASGGGAGHTFAIAPWASGSQTVGMLMSYNGTSVNVGINTYTPAVALDVVGNIKTDTGLVLGGATFAAPSGTAPLFGARAWARFTSAAGSMVGGEYQCTISASGNISKIVRIETGVVDVYFDRPMPDAYYSVVAIASKRLPNRDTNVCWYLDDDNVPTTTKFRMCCTAVNYSTSTMQDVGLGSVIVFR